MEKTGKKSRIAAMVVMIVLAVILIPVLAINLTLIIKGNLRDDVPPDVFGIAPLAVTSGSMAGDNADSFDEGALIFVKLLDGEEKQKLEVGDIVCFRLEENGSSFFVTHRIVACTYGEDGALASVTTKGDANASTDGSVPLESIVGICKGSIAGLGGFAVFLQTPAGIVVFVGIPVFAYIVYDVIRITLYNKKVKAENAAAEKDGALFEKDEEIRRLRALLERGEQEKPEETDREGEEPPEGDSSV